MCVCVCIFICIFIFECELKSNAFFFSTGIITDTGTCIIFQNEPGSLSITSVLLKIVTISISSKVPLLNESMSLCFINSVNCSVSHFISVVFTSSSLA